jgi:chitinase
MAYDYAGPWDKVAAHQANVYVSKSAPQETPFSTDDAVKHYESQGVSAGKIVMGMPLYGRAFQKTNGPGTAFSGVGSGSFAGQDGVWSYKVRTHHVSRLHYQCFFRVVIVIRLENDLKGLLCNTTNGIEL